MSAAPDASAADAALHRTDRPVDDPTEPEADELLAGLTRDQRDAVTTAATRLCIVAGAGSGKTRVLTRRIAWQAATGAIDPRRTLAVTFTRRSAAELRRRVRRLGARESVAAGTFHSVALAIVRRHCTEQGRRPPDLLENRNAFLARHNDRLDRATVNDLAAEVGWARARLVTPEAYPDAAAAAGRRPARGASFTADAYARYEADKRRRRVIDFDDVLALCHTTMTRDATFAAAQRWRHRHILVDEFQDVNPLQFALLESWLGPESTVVVVGDPDQAIYGWNGADPELMNDIGAHLPGTAVLHLRDNFRSTPEILAAAGRLLEREPQPAVRPSGDPPTVTVLEGSAEAVGIARAVRGRHRPGGAWRHQAVLARTNAQLPPLRAAMEAAGIPVRTRGDTALLRRPEIADIVDRWDGRGGLGPQLADESMELGSAASIADPERMAMVEVFLTLAHDHLALEPDASVDDFVSSLRSDDRVHSTTDAVDLVTFHGAKGLEWPIVHLVGLEDGLVPISFARTAAARAEERRLLHVAATRAERELHVSWCRTRRIGERDLERPSSPWLDAFVVEAEPAALPPLEDLRAAVGDAPHPPDDGRRVSSTVGTSVGHDRDDSTHRNAGAVRVTLEDWRTAAAHRARVTPEAVLPDDALDALVEHRPRTTADLAATPGVGAGRARRWGPQLLALIADA